MPNNTPKTFDLTLDQSTIRRMHTAAGMTQLVAIHQAVMEGAAAAGCSQVTDAMLAFALINARDRLGCDIDNIMKLVELYDVADQLHAAGDDVATA